LQLTHPAELECSGVWGHNWGHDGCPGWNKDKFERVNRNIKVSEEITV
jgi:hypothetical protein